MRKYRVSWVRQTSYSAIVEAESEEEAANKVEEGLDVGEIEPDDEGNSYDSNFTATAED